MQKPKRNIDSYDTSPEPYSVLRLNRNLEGTQSEDRWGKQRHPLWGTVQKESKQADHLAPPNKRPASHEDLKHHHALPPRSPHSRNY